MTRGWGDFQRTHQATVLALEAPAVSVESGTSAEGAFGI
jgi:hypothetical protein